MRNSIVRRWRVGTILAVAAVASLATAINPGTAAACVADRFTHEQCVTPAGEYDTVSTRYVGWVYLNLNYCPPGMACTAIYTATTPAWRWTGRSWVQTTLAGGWVYVYPYTGSWRWAWTQSSGWVAVSGGRFELRRY